MTVQEILSHFYINILYEMDQQFLDIQYELFQDGCQLYVACNSSKLAGKGNTLEKITHGVLRYKMSKKSCIIFHIFSTTKILLKYNNNNSTNSGNFSVFIKIISKNNLPPRFNLFSSTKNICSNFFVIYIKRKKKKPLTLFKIII